MIGFSVYGQQLQEGEELLGVSKFLLPSPIYLISGLFIQKVKMCTMGKKQ
jgi:hypothetical protein